MHVVPLQVKQQQEREGTHVVAVRPQVDDRRVQSRDDVEHLYELNHFHNSS